jgi:hypothetical protein
VGFAPEAIMEQSVFLLGLPALLVATLTGERGGGGTAKRTGIACGQNKSIVTKRLVIRSLRRIRIWKRLVVSEGYGYSADTSANQA